MHFINDEPCLTSSNLQYCGKIYDPNVVLVLSVLGTDVPRKVFTTRVREKENKRDTPPISQSLSSSIFGRKRGRGEGWLGIYNLFIRVRVVYKKLMEQIKTRSTTPVPLLILSPK